jgi:hypothetical protein
MSQIYNSKKNYWIKVVFILDRFGGSERELCKRSIIDISSNLWPKQTPCTTGFTSRINPQIRANIFEEVCYTTKKKSIKLIDLNLVNEHQKIMIRWDKRIR